jgi:hypothetical protein
MAKDIEYFMYFMGICASFENWLFSSFAHLLIGLFVPLVFNFWNSLNILDINPLTHEYLEKIFPHSVGCLLILTNVSFAVQKIIVW